MAHQGRLDEAITDYQKALAIVPNAFAENALGGALDSQGHTDEAAQHYLAAIKIKPDFAEARNNFGAVLNSRGKFAEARDQFAEALKIKPDFADAHYNLGNALVALGNLKEAAAEYTADLKLETNDAEAHLNLARIMDHEKDLPGAASHFAEALRVRPDFAEAHTGLAAVLLEQGQDRAAIEHLRTALEDQASRGNNDEETRLGAGHGRQSRFARRRGSRAPRESSQSEIRAGDSFRLGYASCGLRCGRAIFRCSQCGDESAGCGKRRRAKRPRDSNTKPAHALSGRHCISRKSAPVIRGRARVPRVVFANVNRNPALRPYAAASPTWNRTNPRIVISSPNCLATDAVCSLTVTSEFFFTKPWSTRQ